MTLSVLILMFVLAVTIFTSVEAGWWGGDKTKKKTKVKIIIKETEKGRQENTKTEGEMVKFPENNFTLIRF